MKDLAILPNQTLTMNFPVAENLCFNISCDRQPLPIHSRIVDVNINEDSKVSYLSTESIFNYFTEIASQETHRIPTFTKPFPNLDDDHGDDSDMYHLLQDMGLLRRQ